LAPPDALPASFELGPPFWPCLCTHPPTTTPRSKPPSPQSSPMGRKQTKGPTARSCLLLFSLQLPKLLLGGSSTPPTRAALLHPHTPPHPPTNLVTITPAHLALPPTQRCRNQLPNSTIKCRHYTMGCSSKPRITQAELRVLYRPPLLHFLKRPHCGLWTALKPLEYTACLLSERKKNTKALNAPACL